MEKPKFEILDNNKNNSEDLFEIDKRTLVNIFSMNDLDYKYEAEFLRSLLLDRSNKNNVNYLLKILPFLATSSCHMGIPVPKDFSNDFIYQRNEEEINRIKPFVYKLMQELQEGVKELDLEHLDDIAKLYTMQKRKIDWLESEYYREFFDDVENHAIGDVNQYLLEYYNTSEEGGSFENIDNNLRIRYQNSLNFDLDRNTDNSPVAGYYSSNTITIRVNEDILSGDKWSVYKVLVHELVHKASYASYDRIGLKHHFNDQTLEELNEAITEIVAFGIIKSHYENLKGEIDGQRDVDIQSSGYFKYILVVKQIFDRIPQELFVNAMMTKEGFKKLEEKFEELFEGKQSLNDFGKNLSNLYKPQKTKSEVVHFSLDSND